MGKKRREKQPLKAGAATSKKPADRPKPTKRRLWLYRSVAVLVLPVCILVVLEMVMRASGIGLPTRFVTKRTISGAKATVDNPLFTRQFFPAEIARVQDPLVVPVHKASGTYRIFVFGSSAAMGDPASNYSFSRILEVMLRDRYPDINFEVFNAAITGINSHVVYPIAKACLDLDANLCVVYEGNNEVIGPYGAGTIFSPISPSLSFIRADIFLKSLRISQSLGRLIGSWRSDDTEKLWSWGLELFNETRLSPDDPRMEIVYRHFEKNLTDICRIGRARDVPVLLCTVATNIKDCPPFASLHKTEWGRAKPEDARKWTEFHENGIQLQSEGQFDRAIAEYARAGRLDDQYADLHYRLADCYTELQQHDEARTHYKKARDLDALRVRTDGRMNDIVRQMAGRFPKHAVLVDFEEDLAAHAVGGSPGEDFFHDHVHLNFPGNYLLARSVYERVSEFLPEIREQIESDLVGTSEDECARRLAFTPWNRQRILLSMLSRYRREPFVDKPDNAKWMAKWERELGEIESVAFDEVLEDSARCYREVIEMNPTDRVLRYFHAELLALLKDFDKAAAELTRICENVPQWLDPFVLLGNVYVQSGKPDQALERYHQALRISPGNSAVYNNLGELHFRRRRLEKALDYFSIALKRRPGHVDSHYSVAKVLMKQGKLDQAAEHYGTALKLEPASPVPHIYLGNVLIQQGQARKAVAHLTEALRLAPDRADAHFHLANAYGRLGLEQKAREHLIHAKRLDPQRYEKVPLVRF